MSGRKAVIVGAGLCGLLAGRALTDAGWSVLLMDAGDAVGGRLASRAIGPQLFDCGAQFFSVRDAAFARMVKSWLEVGLVVPWGTGFPSWNMGSIQPVADDGFPRYHVPGGMQRLAEHLAQDLPIHRQACVERVDVAAGSVQITFQTAAGIGSLDADAIILTPPAPLLLPLLDAGKQERLIPTGVRDRIARIAFAPCWCLMIEFAGACADVCPSPGGMRCDDEIVAWMASQRCKGMRRSGEGLVVHTQARWSAEHDHDDGQLESCIRAAALRILQCNGQGAWEISGSRLVRWPLSLATTTLPERCLAMDLGAPVICAGDAFGDCPRIEGAVLSGLAAGEALIRS